MSGISSKYVPSEGDPNSNLWIIGEAPGAQEDFHGRPFVGDAGEKLDQVLQQAGSNRSKAFITNLCHHQPPGNKFEALLRSSELQEGLEELKELLRCHKPNVIATLGNWPTYYLTNKTRFVKGQIAGISDWRGSILQYDPTHLGELDHVQKVIPSYHPAYVLRNPIGYVPLSVDFRRIVEDAKFPELNLPEYDIKIDPSNLEDYYDRILSNRFTCSDIENIKNTSIILCICFTLSSNEVIVITLGDNPSPTNRDFVSRIVGNPEIGKCFHYGCHDVTVLRCADYIVEGYEHDTWTQAHSIQPELPRDLAFLASLMTRQPFWKDDGKRLFSGDVKGWSRKRKLSELCIYNGKDGCVTHTIHDIQMKDLEQYERIPYYEYRMELQRALLEIGDNGMYRDPQRTSLLRSAVLNERGRCIIFLRTLAGYEVRNVANQEMQKLLYDDLKLPKRHKFDKKKGKQVVTTDEDALISLLTYCNGHIEKLKTNSAKRDWLRKRRIVELVLKIRGFNRLDESYFRVPVYSDGIARSIYKGAATETGRGSDVKYIDKSGMNMQTIPRGKMEVGADLIMDNEKEFENGGIGSGENLKSA